MDKFNVLYLDPPWAYNDRAGKRGADKRYAVLTTKELMLMRIGDLGAKNCACFMWVTGPFLPDGIRLLKAWGFKYKNAAFVWVKTNKKSGTPFIGMGHYTRSNAEFVLLGMRGKLERASKSVPSIIMEPRKKHSAKPAETRERIVELFGDIPRLELFARDLCPGWEQTGLELDGMDVRDFVESRAPTKGKLSVFKSRT